MWRNGPNHFGLVSIAAHWAIALVTLGLVGLGAWMVGLSYYDPWYNDSLALHKAFGIAVLAAVGLKFAWRCFDRRPAPEVELRRYERIGARVAHALLNLALIVVPISGYLVSTSAGSGIDLFGWAEVPAWFEVSEANRDRAIAVHYYVAYGMLGVVAMHAGAALKHHFIDRGSTLRRMIVPRSPS